MLKVSSNIDEVIARVGGDARQVTFATAVALTRTMKGVEQDLYDDMRRVWDRPTPFSLRSLRVLPARKDMLEASVEIKDRSYSKSSLSPQQIYEHQYFGGPRKQKAIERYAQRAGLISANEILVPASGAKLDAYGNMSRGQVQQVMSQMRLGLDPYAWASKSKRSQANKAKAGRMFWSRGGHLARGVWIRRGRSTLPLMLVADSPVYRARMDMQRVGMASFDRRFEAEFDKAYLTAIRTAR